MLKRQLDALRETGRPRTIAERQSGVGMVGDLNRRSRGRGIWLASQWADHLDVGTTLKPFTVRLTALRAIA